MLYAVGDLHLSMAVPKKMDVFGGVWQGYEDKIRSFLETLAPDDILMLCGDTSWGMNLQEAAADFAFLQNTKARKILIKGNHDYFWDTASKMRRFFDENGLADIDILHNNAMLYENTALCGTRGWFFDEEKGGPQDEKVMMREVGRLRMSLEAGKKLDAAQIFVFLHYPPLYEGYRCAPILDLLREYGVKCCYYGHLHGGARARAVEGMADGVEYRLVSADHLGFRPVKIL